MIYFAGTSFAAQHLKAAAEQRGLRTTDDPKRAGLAFISEDTPTQNGVRDLKPIRDLVYKTWGETHILMVRSIPLILTSQVPPGFTRSLNLPIYHQAETLRVKDAAERALNPEQIIVGCEFPDKALPSSYLDYLIAFNCPIFPVTWEEAEFSKIAINMTLASQVENANRLSKAAEKVGANWDKVKTILAHDKRIGPHSYLEPGRWQDSQHLLRDAVTLEEIERE